MSLGSYILYLRAQKGGITPREVAAEIEMPEHYIHAIELEKHAGDIDSRTKLAEYFGVSVDEFAEYSRSTHARFMEMLKKERRPQVGFLLMNGETLVGTVDGADSSIVKIVELNSGVKTILQRHAIKKWWPLKKSSGFGGGDRRQGGPGGGGGRRPMGGASGGPRTGGRPGQNRPPSSRGGTSRGFGSQGNRSMGGGGYGNYDRPEPGNERGNDSRPRNPF
ncbi:MAG TPA: helix-turn-helix transcriptional regulator [Chloroflexia bacterium]|nr:helix-turn-helix transcriptional regulator [Chloroflexia bacterium]